MSEHEHEDLKELFDRTAERASGPTLTKLAARAADVPLRAGRVPRYLPSWAFSPAFAGVALAVAAAVALVLALPGTAPPEQAVASIVSSSALSVAPAVPPAPAVASHVRGPAAAADLTDSDDLGLGLDDSTDDTSFNVSGPESDQDLDAWLAASKTLEGS